MKIRIKFAKEGAMKFVGHLDTMRYFQKAMRRADVDICYSGGYSPHQIMSFAAPLGVGLESRGEYMDIEVNSTESSLEMLRRLNAVMADGMEVLMYRRLEDHAPGAMSLVAAADYILRFREGYGPEDWKGFAGSLKNLVKQKQIITMKRTKKGEKETDIRPMVFSLKIQGREIFLTVATGSAANLKPDAVIRACYESLGQTLPEFALSVTRTEVYGLDQENKLCPLGDFGEDIE